VNATIFEKSPLLENIFGLKFVWFAENIRNFDQMFFHAFITT